jgi:hypothetical protein
MFRLKSQYKKTCLLFFTLIILRNISLFAQNDFGINPDEPSNDPDWGAIFNANAIGTFTITDPGADPDVPVDGGVSFLLVAGVGYGIKELRKKKSETINK